jgi:membrane dipeptidase
MLAGVGALLGPVLRLGRVRLEGAQGTVEVSTRAVDLVLDTTVVDMLGLLTLDWPRLRLWQARPETLTEQDYRQLDRSGIDVFHPAVETRAHDAYRGAVTWLAGWNRLLSGSACFVAPVATINDLLLVPKRRRPGVIVGFQDSDHFRTAADVAAFHRAGQRVSQLTYNETNRLGSGCYERRDAGLTEFGAEVVGEMNRVGMAIDLSHCGERTTREAIEESRRPVLVTHSNCKALVPRQPRCKSDAVIRLLAAKGGVMGITSVRPFVANRDPTLDDLIDHYERVARVAGIEHVGIGSDVDVSARDSSGRLRPFYTIRGLDQGARVFQIADRLLARGHTARDVALVLGGNFLRALAAIWPEESWSIVPERDSRRDPFCPAPSNSPPPIRPAP